MDRPIGHESFGSSFPESLILVWNVLNRSVEINSIRELYDGLDHLKRRPTVETDGTLALGFDTNAMYRVGLGGLSGAGAIDYLNSKHQGPLVIPGQVIQEIWNNVLSMVEPQAKRIRNKFDELEKEMGFVDQSVGTAGELAKSALNDFIDSHGDWLDPKSQKVFDSTLEVFVRKGVTSYVPRVEFHSLAKVRKETKTPPGYRDNVTNHGDFFVWADFLYGLSCADLKAVDAVVFVTDEKKPDWLRNRVPHPVLVAEALAVAGKSFHLWSVDDFHKHADAVSA